MNNMVHFQLHVLVYIHSNTRNLVTFCRLYNYSLFQ